MIELIRKEHQQEIDSKDAAIKAAPGGEPETEGGAEGLHRYSKASRST